MPNLTSRWQEKFSFGPKVPGHYPFKPQVYHVAIHDKIVLKFNKTLKENKEYEVNLSTTIFPIIGLVIKPL